jgi:hypothetical protein
VAVEAQGEEDVRRLLDDPRPRRDHRRDIARRDRRRTPLPQLPPPGRLPRPASTRAPVGRRAGPRRRSGPQPHPVWNRDSDAAERRLAERAKARLRAASGRKDGEPRKSGRGCDSGARILKGPRRAKPRGRPHAPQGLHLACVSHPRPRRRGHRGPRTSKV